MEFVNIGIGLLIIAIGFLVKRNPNLIAGYNGLSEEEKKKVDIEGLSTWMRNGFVITGIMTPVVYYLVYFLGYEQLAGFSMMFAITIGIFIVAITGQRFNKSD